MNDSNAPPDGSERAAKRPAASDKPAAKPEAKARAGEAAAATSPLVSKSPLPTASAVKRGTGSGAANGASTTGANAKLADRPAAAASQPRASATVANKSAAPASERRTNGSAAAATLATSTARPRVAAPAPAPARQPVKAATPATRVGASPSAVPGAGEPYPPLSERLVNGIGMAAVGGKLAEQARIAPRSPRTALEPDTVQLPVRRSRSARHPLVIAGNAIITIFLMLAVVGAFVLYVGKQRFDAPGPLTEDRVVQIQRGSGIWDIADTLARKGVIDQPWVFIGGVMVLGAREDLKAGEYQFKAHSSLRDVVATIADGKVVMHQFSVPEGLTSEQIVQRLVDDPVLTGNVNDIPAEGSLLPDTYNFTRGTSRAQLIQRMQQAQARLLKEIWERRSPDLPLKSPEQLIILASIVEKETGRADERTRIAAVFINRLKQKMRLQSDPTIIYGLVGGRGTLGRPIMKREIEQPTPYNTYLIDGLPPGPIANPGRAALEAAANPARTRELYFVADGTGGHAFAETYEQHQKNVARLRQIEGGQRDQAAPDSQAAPAAPQAAAATPTTPSPTRHRPARRRARPAQ